MKGEVAAKPTKVTGQSLNLLDAGHDSKVGPSCGRAGEPVLAQLLAKLAPCEIFGCGDGAYFRRPLAKKVDL
jgi:hypothetical protein